MKTVLEHIQQLPPKIRLAFLNEFSRVGCGRLTDKFSSLSSVINCSITWSATKQVGKFWDKLYIKIIRYENRVSANQ